VANYVLSNANRFYAAVESSYGQVAAVTQANRFPAVRLSAHQAIVPGKRRDKTGTRTFLGSSPGARRETVFDLRTYLTSWTGIGVPSYGPLFQAALGGTPQVSSGLTVAATPSTTGIQTTAPHGLLVGSGVSFSGEIRFVTSVPDASSVVVNAPFSNSIPAGASLATTATYTLGTALPSLSVYDYWDPASTVSRLVTGAVVNQLAIAVNGDFHDFTFAGYAADLLDSMSFAAGNTGGGITTFPVEPTPGQFDYSIVPGHLGQAWLGQVPQQFMTLTAAQIHVNNNISMRTYEFGSSYPRSAVPGPRAVSSSFSVFTQDDTGTNALYVAAKQRMTIPAMLKLGQQQGQLIAIYLPAVTPEIPEFNDTESRLQWTFTNNLAQGTSNDEMVIAFA